MFVLVRGHFLNLLQHVSTKNANIYQERNK